MEMKIKHVAFKNEDFSRGCGTRLLNLIVCFFFRGENAACLFFLSKENKEERRSARAYRTIYLRLGSKSAFEEEMHKQRFWGCFRGTDA
jgi:hypothetical protein